ncbi:hypothetical protein SAMN06269185_0272 [Natronoarchaeum philippinense]|uniref:Uncharacterized protein n=1 Tax=Natronoarchaeum philippinense TaxID=558529 RepID=A0A285N6T0_NATPI|nr:hypothetical protein [Natronoarchaeum philippinense]SNZ03421.1 hypothetical protein SAMN06269185_0272 [Natronoarchaeum philippinense]
MGSKRHLTPREILGDRRRGRHLTAAEILRDELDAESASNGEPDSVDDGDAADGAEFGRETTDRRETAGVGWEWVDDDRIQSRDD